MSHRKQFIQLNWWIFMKQFKWYLKFAYARCLHLYLAYLLRLVVLCSPLRPLWATITWWPPAAAALESISLLCYLFVIFSTWCLFPTFCESVCECIYVGLLPAAALSACKFLINFQLTFSPYFIYAVVAVAFAFLIKSSKEEAKWYILC